MPNGLIVAVAIAALCAIQSAAADTIYVSNEKDNTITVVDGATLATLKTIPVGQRPRGIVLSKDARDVRSTGAGARGGMKPIHYLRCFGGIANREWLRFLN